MRFLALLIFIGGAYAKPPSQRVGCENDPCQHQCEDTSDSYYCLCFENYILQPDQHSCLHKNTEDLENAYLGCWTDQAQTRDLPYQIWTREDDASVPQCMHDCNTRGFDFAGLQAGTQCWCGNTYERAYTDDGVCNIDCPGAPAQNCGGTMSNAVYKVNRDERYIGCFTEVPGDPDLSDPLWGPLEGNSVDECIIACGTAGFSFAGIFDGGQCSCGNTYGRHGSPGDMMCNEPCYDGYASSNCGGNTTNAIYRVVKGLDLAGLKKLNAYKTEGNRAELAMDNLFIYPHSLGLYTDRLLVYASDTVNTIYDDLSCTNGDCYSLCGEIDVPTGLDRYKSDVVIRRFHLRLTEVEALVGFPEEAERVYVFAQTFYIDQSVDFPWSLYIRARQIIINYEANPSITYDHTGPTFSVDIADAVMRGLPSDLVFQKQSLLCAQMMISSTTDEHNRIGWDIIDDLARDRAYDDEQQHFLDHVRAVRAGFTSIGRNDIHWAPYYTQLFYVNTLEIFYDQITTYNDAFQEMLDEFMECENFVDRAGTLIGIWTNTVVAQATIIKNHAAENLAISKATYQGIIVEIQESIEELKAAIQAFIEGIKKAIRQLIRKALFGLAGSIFNMVTGESPAGAKQAEDDLEAAAEGTIDLSGFGVTVENLAKGTEQMFIFNAITEPIQQTEDFERYIDSVEIVSGLYTLLPEWANLKYHIDVIFRAPVFRDIEGGLGFAFACFDLANWGEALNRALIEHATNIRIYVSATALWKNKVEMEIRYNRYFAEVEADCNKQGETLIRFAEQNYDLALELNEQLLQYCQAYYYEEMMFCPEGSRPDFSYSVTDLLSSVNQAQLNALYFSRRSTGKIDIEIVDSPEAWDNCTDTHACPVKLFRETRMLYYELPLDHPRFEGLDLYVVDELEVYIDGAFSTDSTDYVRLILSSSGPFYNRRTPDEAIFLTRALSEMKFQYDLVTDEIELRADLYQTSGSTIKHVTPFTTWLIQVDPAFDHIDISQVNMVQMVFHGPFLNRRDEEGSDA